MAQYYSEADYCAEEMNRPYRSPGYRHGGGGEHYAVRKEYCEEEIDEVERARRGHYHGHGGHLGRSHGHGASGHLGHSGSHREHHGHGHGYGDPCERKYDSCTGQYYD